MEYCQSHGIAVQAYSPLAKGTKLANPTLVEVRGGEGGEGRKEMGGGRGR